MDLKQALDLLDLNELRSPYDKKEFVCQLATIDKTLSDRFVLVSLARLELTFLFPEFEEQKLIRLYDWALNSHTEHIRVVLSEIGMCYPILPAMQKIILLINQDYLNDNTPIQNQSASVIIKKQHQIEAMHMALNLICYLEDSKSVALAKASYWIKGVVGEDSRGFSEENLKLMLEKNKHHYLPFLEAEKKALTESEHLAKVRELSKLVDGAR